LHLQDRASWAPKFAALRLAHPLVAYFSKPLDGVMPALMGATWTLLLAAQVGVKCSANGRLFSHLAATSSLQLLLLLQLLLVCCCSCANATFLCKGCRIRLLIRSVASIRLTFLLLLPLLLLLLLYCRCSRCTSPSLWRVVKRRTCLTMQQQLLLLAMRSQLGLKAYLIRWTLGCKKQLIMPTFADMLACSKLMVLLVLSA
jgi:hypothetical protein